MKHQNKKLISQTADDDVLGASVLGLMEALGNRSDLFDDTILVLITQLFTLCRTAQVVRCGTGPRRTRRERRRECLAARVYVT